MGIIEFLKEEKFMVEESFKETIREYKRDVYSEVGKSNITVLYGLRGTGKTTLLAQKYFETEDKTAIHGEHLNLAGYTLKDVISSIKYLVRDGYLFIDEITKLKNWSEEIKVLSDLHPKLKIVVTGSSAVDLQDARRVLARRAEFINLKPFTLNEFLRIKHGLNIASFNPFSEDPLTQALKTELDGRGKFKDMSEVILQYRYMNLPYLMEKPISTLLDVIERIIYEDIGSSASFNEDVLNKFLPLLKLLALSEKTSYDNLSKDLGLGKGTVIKMIGYLVKANVIRIVYPYVSGKAKVRKEPKYLFTSPAIRQVLLNLLGEKERAIGLSREDMFAMHINELFYLRTGPDYVWKNALFEVGGPGKDTRQFKGLSLTGKRFVVHEGLDISSGEVLKIPFYVFLSHF